MSCNEDLKCRSMLGTIIVWGMSGDFRSIVSTLELEFGERRRGVMNLWKDIMDILVSRGVINRLFRRFVLWHLDLKIYNKFGSRIINT